MVPSVLQECPYNFQAMDVLLSHVSHQSWKTSVNKSKVGASGELLPLRLHQGVLNLKTDISVKPKIAVTIGQLNLIAFRTPEDLVQL